MLQALLQAARQTKKVLLRRIDLEPSQERRATGSGRPTGSEDQMHFEESEDNLKIRLDSPDSASDDQPMTPEPHDHGAPTRRSLISRLRNREDHASWQEFFDTYWKLIYAVALKSGLSNSEAEEVVQETVISIAKKMPSFEYDPAKCTFKGWLKHVTRLRIIDQFRKRRPDQNRPEDPLTNTSGTDVIARIPDPHTQAIEEVWDREWEGNLIDAAIERVKAKSKAIPYQIFYMHMVQQVPAREVARMLGISLGRVYFACRGISKLVKEERKRLEKSALSGSCLPMPPDAAKKL
jgi:RNA polymerase sigma-70 factor (ECF subfamily)